jgi:hypothetical protein
VIVTGLHVLVVLYSLVLIGTVLRQLPAISSSRLLRWDSLGILPGFSFFAPHPGSHDYVLVYRTGRNGVVGGWRDPFRLTRRRASTAIWNPSKRLRKAIIDVAGALAHEMIDKPRSDPSIILSVPYLLLLDFTSRATPPSATHVQFAIMTSASGRDKSEVDLLVLSELHEVER